MPQADVLQLVTDVSDGLNDSTACTTFYSDVVYLIALDPGATLYNTQSVDPGAGTSTTPLPTAIVTIKALIYSETHLSKTNLQGAKVWDTQWFTTLGEPKMWMDQVTDRHTVSLIPVPSSPPVGAALPVDPSTTNQGQGALTILYTENRANVHGDEELALALEIMAREFSRDSDHTDHTLSQACRTLSGVLFHMLELTISDDVEPPAKALAEERQGGGGA